MLFFSTKTILYTVIFFGVMNIHLFSKDITKDTTLIKEIIISATKNPTIYSESARKIEVIGREQISEKPVQNITDILKLSSNIDIRRRGSAGSQADIGIRGGTFDQTLILLNGIKMNDPQTGHHNFNLPIDPESITKVEILGGGASRVFGPNAFSGAVNFITSSSGSNTVKFSIDGGNYAYNKIGLSVNNSFSGIENLLSFNRESSDGYINNTDFKFYNFYDLLTLKTDFGKFYLDFGYNNKAYGANSFYSAKYPEQFEKTKTTFTSLKFTSGETFQYLHTFSYRRHQDRFELFRNQWASWYNGHNYHLTDVLSAENRVNYIYEDGSSSIGLEYRYEHIYSNVLGEQMPSPIEVPGESGNYFTKSSVRNSLNVYFEQILNIDDLIFTGGLLYNYTDKFSNTLYPGIDLAYLFNDNLTVFASYNRSLRFPTFTDLFYSSATNKGNIDLKPETADNYEIGLKMNFDNEFSSNISAFYRNGSNMIDWIKKPGQDIWNAMNLTKVNSYGLELNFTINTNHILGSELLKYISVSYSVMDMNSKSIQTEFISAYILDYLKHKLNFSIAQDFGDDLKVFWALSLEDRAGSFIEYPSNNKQKFQPNVFFDIKLSKIYQGFNFYINAKNITNTRYFDISNVPQPGREFYFGISYKLDFDKL